MTEPVGSTHMRHHDMDLQAEVYSLSHQMTDGHQDPLNAMADQRTDLTDTTILQTAMTDPLVHPYNQGSGHLPASWWVRPPTRPHETTSGVDPANLGQSQLAQLEQLQALQAQQAVKGLIARHRAPAGTTPPPAAPLPQLCHAECVQN